MMKKAFVFLLVLLIAIPAFSEVKIGLKAGVSTNSLNMPSIKTIASGTSNITIDAISTAKYGFHGGLFLRLSLLGIYIQPELLLSSRTNEYALTGTNVPTVKQSLTKLDIPVMVGFKLGPIRINAGPSANMLLNQPKDIISSSTYDNVKSKMTVGYQAGVGLDILKRLTIDLRYEGSLKKYETKIKNLTNGSTINLDDRANAFLLSVGLMF
jgi:hypothetical protein